MCETSPPYHFLHFFFFNDTATTEIYTLSLHDALPISSSLGPGVERAQRDLLRYQPRRQRGAVRGDRAPRGDRSEEHTSELQSQSNLVCRLLLEKKKFKTAHTILASAHAGSSSRLVLVR